MLFKLRQYGMNSYPLNRFAQDVLKTCKSSRLQRTQIYAYSATHTIATGTKLFSNKDSKSFCVHASFQNL